MRIIHLTIFFFVFIFQASAQQWLGISQSNYGGTYSVYSNPANVADTRYRCFINLAGVNVSAANNYVSWNAPYSILGLVTGATSSQYKASDGSVLWKSSYLTENTTNAINNAFVNGEVRGPGFIYSIKDSKFSVGLTTRLRILGNAANTTTDIAHLLVAGTGDPLIIDVSKFNSHFALNINGLTEIAATVGYVLEEEDVNFFKVGLTLKKINGIAHTHIIGEDVTYKVSPAFFNPATRQWVHLFNSVGQYGIVNDASYQNLPIGKALLGSTAGHGYGADIGFVYEFRPEIDNYTYREKGQTKTDETVNKYTFKVGVALLDVGSVKYSDPNLVTQVAINDINKIVQEGTFSKINFEKLANGLNTVYDIQPNQINHEITTSLPMALSVNVDYKIKENIYVSAVVVQSLRNANSNTMSQPSMVAITPRYEKKYVEVSLPISLLNNYQSFCIGIAGRAGPFFIGSDNFGGLINLGNPRGVDIYTGLFIPLYKKLPESNARCPKNNEKKTFGEKIKTIFKKN